MKSVGSNIIKIDGLVKDYLSIGRAGARPKLSRVRALSGVQGVFDGGILGLVGPNGAGKSTLIQIMAGVLKATRGSLTIFDMDSWRSTKNIKKRVAFLMEEPEYPPLAGLRFLRYVGELRGMDRISAERHARDALERIGMADSGRRSITSYSAGMRRRLGIATAFIGDPALIVLDEPAKTLDPQGRHLLSSLISDAHREHGTSFVISSHILSDLERICTEAWVLHRGEFVVKGTIAEISERFRPDLFVVEVDRPQLMFERMSELVPGRVTIQGHRLTIQGDPEQVSRMVSDTVAALGLVLRKFEPAMGELERVLFGGESDAVG